MDSIKLIETASAKLRPYRTEDDRLHADVASALISKEGKLYVGVCVDTAGPSFCAEQSAIASMITDGCYEIDKIVAVWRDENTDKLHVLPPCGVCREFMHRVSKSNLEAEVILGKNSSKKLKELLPNHEWPQPLDED